MSISNEEFKAVFRKLKNREENPKGDFDNGGRWYSHYEDIIDVRPPSAKHPYSQMQHCRTLKFIKKLAVEKSCENIAELEKIAFL